MTSKQTKQSTPLKQLIHEVNAGTRLHRLVIISGGRPDNSPWFETSNLGNFRGYFFMTQEQGGLPAGVFRISPSKFEVLA